MSLCFRCNSKADSDLNYIHNFLLCAECNKTCCFKCSYWYPYDQLYGDPLEPDNFGDCSIKDTGTGSYEICNNFEVMNGNN